MAAPGGLAAGASASETMSGPATSDADDLTPIAVEKVCHAYGRGKLRKQILHDVSIEVARGEIVILTGPSGSGKTTLLTLMGALRGAQEGSLRILGAELNGASERKLVSVRRQIGYVFQSHNLLPALRVEDNVRMALQLSGRISRRKAHAPIRAVLERVGLGDQLHKKIDQLSGGQRQRVAIARALINQPRIILADEPTASLDKQSGRDVADLIEELAREGGATVVLVTHDNRILDIADRIVHLEDGRVRPLADAVAQQASEGLELIAERDPRGYRRLLAFARALARVARADTRVEETELGTMRQILSELTELGPGEIDFVLSMAVDHGAGDVGAAPFSEREKRQIVSALHAVAESDGEFCDRERAEIDAIVADLGLEDASD